MNKLYQFIWYKILVHLVPKSKDRHIFMTSYKWRFLFQYILSVLMGGANAVLLGDSNQEVLSKYKIMKRFKKLTINMGKGGSVAIDVYFFFVKTKIGRFVYNKIKDKKISINTMGNYCLQDRMDEAETGLKLLYEIFPNAYYTTIPPIRANWLDFIDGELHTQSYYEISVDRLNQLLYCYANGKVIDLYKLFNNMNLPDDFLFLVFQDAVHYTNEASTYIVGILNEVL